MGGGGVRHVRVYLGGGGGNEKRGGRQGNALAPAVVQTVPSVVDYVVDMGHSVLGRVVRQDVNAFHVREVS